MDNQTIGNALPATSAADDEISLLDLAIVLAKRKKLVLGLPVVVAVLAVVYSLMLPNIYTATTRILPPAQAQSAASAMLAQLGGLAGALGAGSGMKSPNDVYLAMLKSRTIADALIERFDLNSRFEQKFQSATRAVLDGATKIASGKDSVITVEFDDKDPKFAADIANAYVEELKKLMGRLAVTEASQRRLFFEEQLHAAYDNLTKAEVSAKQGIERNGLTNVEAQGRSMLETTARLRGMISAKEVQIASMRGFAAERNPDLIKAQQELSALRTELTKMEGTHGGVDLIASSGRGFENLKRLRDVKYYETIVELLAKQYEMAKIDEAKDAAVIQVLDKAIEPDRKSKPKRSQIVILATLAAGVVAVLWAFIREAVAKGGQNPNSARRLKSLKAYLRFG